jgi:four helix bundle protein
MAKSIIAEKTLDFSVNIVKASQFLNQEKHEYDISRQLKRAGTSIGANVSEALNASSRKDFIHKMTLALKEANEAFYWIQILKRTDYNHEIISNLEYPCHEIIKILRSIILTSKNRLNHSTLKDSQ